MTSCGMLRPVTRDQRFTEQFPYEDVNRTLVLRPVEGVTEDSLGGVITVQLENHSDEMVSYSPEDGIVGLAYDTSSETWVEVENTVSYPDAGLLLAPRGSEIPSIAAVYFEPPAAQRSQLTDVRILVVGHVWTGEQGPGTAVAGYLDIALLGEG